MAHASGKVMAGLDPAIQWPAEEGLDARVEPAHDEVAAVAWVAPAAIATDRRR